MLHTGYSELVLNQSKLYRLVVKIVAKHRTEEKLTKDCSNECDLMLRYFISVYFEWNIEIN